MIYIHGDTHGEYSYFSDRWLPGQSQWTSVDKLIITGDFGFVFRGERNSLAEKTIWKRWQRNPTKFYS